MKHKISLPRRVAAFALAFLLVLPNAYAAAGEQKLQTSTQIAQGLTYRNTVTVNDGSRVESFSFELSPDSPVRPILWQGSETIYTSATINWAVSTAQPREWQKYRREKRYGITRAIRIAVNSFIKQADFR